MATSYISYEDEFFDSEHRTMRGIMEEAFSEFRDEHGAADVTRASCSYNSDRDCYEVTIRAES